MRKVAQGFGNLPAGRFPKPLLHYALAYLAIHHLLYSLSLAAA